MKTNYNGSISGCMSRIVTASEKYTLTLSENQILQADDSTVNRLRNMKLLGIILEAMTYK